MTNPSIFKTIRLFAIPLKRAPIYTDMKKSPVISLEYTQYIIILFWSELGKVPVHFLRNASLIRPALLLSALCVLCFLRNRSVCYNTLCFSVYGCRFKSPSADPPTGSLCGGSQRRTASPVHTCRGRASPQIHLVQGDAGAAVL